MTIHDFLQSWYNWATSGAPENDPFQRHMGLCGNLEIFEGIDHRNSTLQERLRYMFDIGCGDGFYPFGAPDYNKRMMDGTQHTCPVRLEWVKEQLK